MAKISAFRYSDQESNLEPECLMNVSLTPEWEQFIAHEVSTGRYQTASEVVREGLRLLEERDRSKPDFTVSSIDELRDKVREGVESLDRGDCTEIEGDAALDRFFDDIKAQGRDRMKKASRRAA